MVISHSSPYVFCTLAWNIFCQFWEGYPISPRLQHHFGSILGWGVKTSSDHCNKSLWFTQSGCNTGFRRMLRLLRKNETKTRWILPNPKKHLQYPTIVVGFFPKINNSWTHQSENLQDPIFPYISWPAIHLLQLKAFWQICSWGTSKKHRLNVAIANRSESHSPCPAGGKLMNNCTCPTGTFSGAKGGVSLRYSWSWTPGVNWSVETENWCFVIQCVVILCLNPYSVLTSCIPLRPLDCLRTNLVERDAWWQSVQSIWPFIYILFPWIIAEHACILQVPLLY